MCGRGWWSLDGSEEVVIHHRSIADTFWRRVRGVLRSKARAFGLTFELHVTEEAPKLAPMQRHHIDRGKLDLSSCSLMCRWEHRCRVGSIADVCKCSSKTPTPSPTTPARPWRALTMVDRQQPTCMGRSRDLPTQPAPLTRRSTGLKCWEHRCRVGSIANVCKCSDPPLQIDTTQQCQPIYFQMSTFFPFVLYFCLSLARSIAWL